MTLDDSQSWAERALRHVRRSITPYAYLSDTTSSYASVGVQIQDVVHDHGKEGDSLKIIFLDNVARFESGGAGKIQGPTRKEFLHQAKIKYSSMIEGSQRALLPTMYSKLVHVPEVSLSMSPLRKILIYLEEVGSITPQKLGHRLSPEEKSTRYFSLLEDLQYIAKEDGYYVPGTATRHLQAAKIQPPELYERILGDVIRQRPKYLQDVLHWTMMVPYLRWSNAYYLPCYEIGRTIKIDRSEFVRNYRRFYQVKHDDLTEINQIQRIVDAKVVSRAGGYFQGESEILTQFSKLADKDPSLEPLHFSSA